LPSSADQRGLRQECTGAATLNNKTMFEYFRTALLLEPHETAIVDSGCTCLNKFKSQNMLTVRLPNGATMESIHTASLDIPELNKSASMAHIFLGMANHSLLSVGQLCNEG
jgi:hypothetical protein